MTSLDGQPAIVYRRTPEASDISVVIEASDNLEDWTEPSWETVSVDAEGERETVTRKRRFAICFRVRRERFFSPARPRRLATGRSQLDLKLEINNVALGL